MTRKSIGATLGVACALAWLAAPAPGAAQDRTATIVGCAVKGSDGDGFLLANAVERVERTTSVTGAEGTLQSSSTTLSMHPSRVLYWLDDDDDQVEAFIGHQVEVVGEVEGDVEEGNIKVEREEGIVELEINADGHDTTVRLPHVPSAIGTSGSVGDDEKELNFLVRKLDVDSARSMAPTCQ